jgi:hypothetical protein
MPIVPGPCRDHPRRQLPNALIALAVVRIVIERETDLGDGLEFPADREPRRLGGSTVVGHGAAFTAAQVESRSNSPAVLELTSIRNPPPPVGVPVTTSV